MADHHRWRFVHRSVFLSLALAVFCLLLWLSYLYPVHWDMTPSKRHSLSETGRALAKRLPDGVELVAFVRREKDRRSVRRFVGRYQRHNPGLKLTFIDPWTRPDEVNRYRPTAIGEIIVLHNSRRHRLSPERSHDDPSGRLTYREEHLNQILGRLIRDKDFTIHFLAGHGERLPMEKTNRGFSLWGGVLQQNGYVLESISPAHIHRLDQVRLLVIASPQIPLTPDETQRILRYLERGGNLLWLTDPGPGRGLDELASVLRLRLSEQAVVTTRPVPGIPEPGMLLPDPLQYGDHPALAHFALQTLLINSRFIRRQEAPAPGFSWRLTPLIKSGEDTTTRDGTSRGPFDLAVALERARDGDGNDQRAVVVGDGDLLSNTYLENGGNAEFGLRLIDWLTYNESSLAVPPSSAPDATVNIPSTIRSIQLAFFVGILPIGLMTGGLLWRRYRRHL